MSNRCTLQCGNLKIKMKKSNNITTLKLEKETKERLEKLREHKRETYDDIIRKIMYVLNTVRDEPVKAKAILEFIDEKRKRMFETEFSKKEERASTGIPTNQKEEKPAQRSIPNKAQRKPKEN
jgi:predicted DNA-binding protein